MEQRYIKFNDDFHKQTTPLSGSKVQEIIEDVSESFNDSYGSKRRGPETQYTQEKLTSEDWWFNPIFDRFKLETKIRLKELFLGIFIGALSLQYGRTHLNNHLGTLNGHTAEFVKVLNKPKSSSVDLHDRGVKYLNAQQNNPVVDVASTVEHEKKDDRLSGIDKKLDYLIRKHVEMSASKGHSIEMGVQAFIGFEKRELNNVQSASTAEVFDAATDSGTNSSSNPWIIGKPDPIVKVGVYCNLPLFRK